MRSLLERLIYRKEEDVVAYPYKDDDANLRVPEFGFGMSVVRAMEYSLVSSLSACLVTFILLSIAIQHDGEPLWEGIVLLLVAALISESHLSSGRAIITGHRVLLIPLLVFNALLILPCIILLGIAARSFFDYWEKHENANNDSWYHQHKEHYKREMRFLVFGKVGLVTLLAWLITQIVVIAKFCTFLTCRQRVLDAVAKRELLLSAAIPSDE